MSAGPRLPTNILVVDANIVLGIVLGRRSRPIFELALARRLLATSARAREEVLGCARDLQQGVPTIVPLAADLLRLVRVADEAEYASRMEAAALVLQLAPASRNGSMRDAHILALAWSLDADIWSHDRDFAGSGWPSWSNANLRAALAGT